MMKKRVPNIKFSDTSQRVKIPQPAAFYDDGPYHGCKPDFSTDFLGLFLTSDERNVISS
jgi:hypothetical protein